MIPEQTRQKFLQLFERHVPENAVHYCYDLWNNAPFHFKVTRKRNTKLGDYRYNPQTREHTITVNYNLNPFSFLITYIHEYAHLSTTIKHGRAVAPHGPQWRNEFRNLMVPVLNDLIFPQPLLTILKRHMVKPKASTQADPALVGALRKYDNNTDAGHILDEIKTGAVFVFQGKRYKKLETRRTRVLCHHIDTGRRYLIPKIAEVRPGDALV